VTFFSAHDNSKTGLLGLLECLSRTGRRFPDGAPYFCSAHTAPPPCHSPPLPPPHFSTLPSKKDCIFSIVFGRLLHFTCCSLCPTFLFLCLFFLVCLLFLLGLGGFGFVCLFFFSFGFFLAVGCNCPPDAVCSVGFLVFICRFGLSVGTFPFFPLV